MLILGFVALKIIKTKLQVIQVVLRLSESVEVRLVKQLELTL